MDVSVHGIPSVVHLPVILPLSLIPASISKIYDNVLDAGTPCGSLSTH